MKELETSSPPNLGRHIGTMAMFVFLVLIILGEMGARWWFHVPASRSLMARSAWRSALLSVAPSDVVVAGSSRSMAAFRVELMSRLLGRDVVNVSYPAQNFEPILRRLLDNGFRGVVITDYTGPSWFSKVALNPWRHLAWADDVEAEPIIHGNIIDWLDDRFAVRNAEYIKTMRAFLSGNKLANLTFARSVITSRQEIIRPVGSTELNERVLADIAQRKYFESEKDALPYDLDRTRARIESINAITRELVARGGLLIVVNFPQGGVVGEWEKRFFPDNQFWDLAVSSGSAIYFDTRRDSSLGHIQPFDGSHVSNADAAVITERFVELYGEVIRAHAAP